MPFRRGAKKSPHVLETTNPKVLVVRVAKLRAAARGTYFNSRIAASTRAAISSETGIFRLMTRLTDEIDTPAMRATSSIVVRVRKIATPPMGQFALKALA